jgi:hypothetical protein
VETSVALYAHFFLFVCPECRNYLASVCASPESSLEIADAHVFGLRCACHWTGQLAGFTALRHWVELGNYIDLTGVPHCSLFFGEAA